MSWFVTNDVSAPSVVPETAGGIQLEWHTGAVDIEIYIDASNQFRFFAEDAGSRQRCEVALAGHEDDLGKSAVRRSPGCFCRALQIPPSWSLRPSGYRRRLPLRAEGNHCLDPNRIQDFLESNNRDRLIVALLIPTDYLLGHPQSPGQFRL